MVNRQLLYNFYAESNQKLKSCLELKATFFNNLVVKFTIYPKRLSYIIKHLTYVSFSLIILHFTDDIRLQSFLEGGKIIEIFTYFCRHALQKSFTSIAEKTVVFNRYISNFLYFHGFIKNFFCRPESHGDWETGQVCTVRHK